MLVFSVNRLCGNVRDAMQRIDGDAHAGNARANPGVQRLHGAE